MEVTISSEDQFHEDWRSLGPKYGGQSLRIHHIPYLISSEEALFLEHVVESLQKIIEKITQLFLQGKFRDVLQFDPRLQDLILFDPGYSLACPFNRWDSFYEGGNTLKFLELNTDGTSGMVYVEALDHLYWENFGLRAQKPCQFKRKVLKTLLTCYSHFRNASEDKPHIAIVDWQEVSTRTEQEALSRFFRDEGYEAILCDPRSLRYDGRTLWNEDLRIDLVYRRVVTGEYLKRWDEVKPLTQAYLDRNVCLVGSFRSQVGFDKRTFEILSSSDYDFYFTEVENQLRNQHIPWTRVLKEGQDWSSGVLKNRDKFVLKPAALNRGQGVMFGNQISDAEWVSKFENLPEQDYIVQEKVNVPLWGEERKGLHLGHFVFGGQLAGWMCRMGMDPILSDRSDDRLVPCLRMD